MTTVQLVIQENIAGLGLKVLFCIPSGGQSLKEMRSFPVRHGSEFGLGEKNKFQKLSRMKFYFNLWWLNFLGY